MRCRAIMRTHCLRFVSATMLKEINRRRRIHYRLSQLRRQAYQENCRQARVLAQENQPEHADRLQRYLQHIETVEMHNQDINVSATEHTSGAVEPANTSPSTDSSAHTIVSSAEETAGYQADTETQDMLHGPVHSHPT